MHCGAPRIHSNASTQAPPTSLGCRRCSARTWALARLALDMHLLLLWLQNMGPPGEARAAALYRLAAVGARLLRGRWPGPPAAPNSWAPPLPQLLKFDPLRADALPGLRDLEGCATTVEARLLRLRHLSAVVAHIPVRQQCATSADLSSLAGLEAAVGAAPSDQNGFGEWAEALAGSDLDDFIRLRSWRRATEASLAADPVKQFHLAAAISPRCAAVH